MRKDAYGSKKPVLMIKLQSHKDSKSDTQAVALAMWVSQKAPGSVLFPVGEPVEGRSSEPQGKTEHQTVDLWADAEVGRPGVP